jgi:hypothetical protein
VIPSDPGPANDVTPPAEPSTAQSVGPKKLWTLTTTTGRSIECFALAEQDRIEMLIHYDGSLVVSQAFEAGEEDLALTWAEQQRLLRQRDAAQRLRCPRCDEGVVRSRTRGYEHLLRFFTSRRPHRCTRCGWRGWRRNS